MFAVFVTFEYPAGFDRARLRAIAETASAKFAGMPLLRQKAFTLDEERQRATNVYLWESEQAARAFFTPELARRVKELYGVPARVEFAEVAALVDNTVARAA